MAACIRSSRISTRCCEWRSRRASNKCSCTASWTAATRRRRAAPATCGEIQKKMRTIGVGRIASVSGRYYAMDRDKRWERIERAFDAMVLGNGRKGHGSGGGRRALLRKGRDRRVHRAGHHRRRAQRAGGPDPRRRCGDLLQLPRRPRARDDHGADRCETRAPVAVARAQESALRHHDAVRQDVHAAVRAAARASRTTSWPMSWRS